MIRPFGITYKGGYSNVMKETHGEIARQTMEANTKKAVLEIPRGKPKSGRTWKTTRTKRHSEIKNVKRFKTSWTEKMARKDDKRKVKELQQRLKGDKDREKQLRRLREQENKKRKLENQRKAEIVQPIKNTAKIKKMKKKQLRTIETR